MKTKTLFVCDLCGWSSQDKEEIARCEISDQKKKEEWKEYKAVSNNIASKLSDAELERFVYLLERDPGSGHGFTRFMVKCYRERFGLKAEKCPTQEKK